MRCTFGRLLPTFIAALLFACAPPATYPMNGPIESVDRDIMFASLGHAEIVWTYINKTSTPIPAPRLQRSCTCSPAAFQPEEVQPGDTGAVRILLTLRRNLVETGSVVVTWSTGATQQLTYSARAKPSRALILAPSFVSRAALLDRAQVALRILLDYGEAQPSSELGAPGLSFATSNGTLICGDVVSTTTAGAHTLQLECSLPTAALVGTSEILVGAAGFVSQRFAIH